VTDQQLLLDNRWPHTIALLQLGSGEGCGTAVVIESTRYQATPVLKAIGVFFLLSSVLAWEDMANPKPDTEIYLLVASRARILPNERMVVVASPPDVLAGFATGMHVIAVTTPFIDCGLLGTPGLDQQWVVRDPLKLTPAIQQPMAKQRRSGSLVL
jgi:beta-phosphoglucomutase